MINIERTPDGLPVLGERCWNRHREEIHQSVVTGEVWKIMERDNPALYGYLNAISQRTGKDTIAGGVCVYALLRKQSLFNCAQVLSAKARGESYRDGDCPWRSSGWLPRVSDHNLEALEDIARQGKKESDEIMDRMERENRGLHKILTLFCSDGADQETRNEGFALGAGIVYEALRRQAASETLEKDLGLKS